MILFIEFVRAHRILSGLLSGTQKWRRKWKSKKNGMENYFPVSAVCEENSTRTANTSDKSFAEFTLRKSTIFFPFECVHTSHFPFHFIPLVCPPPLITFQLKIYISFGRSPGVCISLRDFCARFLYAVAEQTSEQRLETNLFCFHLTGTCRTRISILFLQFSRWSYCNPTCRWLACICIVVCRFYTISFLFHFLRQFCFPLTFHIFSARADES